MSLLEDLSEVGLFCLFDKKSVNKDGIDKILRNLDKYSQKDIEWFRDNLISADNMRIEVQNKNNKKDSWSSLIFKIDNEVYKCENKRTVTYFTSSETREESVNMLIEYLRDNEYLYNIDESFLSNLSDKFKENDFIWESTYRRKGSGIVYCVYEDVFQSGEQMAAKLGFYSPDSSIWDKCVDIE